MSQPTRISVVVATHNRSERLAATLEGLRRQALPRSEFDVVIVDDGSSDDTPGVLEGERALG